MKKSILALAALFVMTACNQPKKFLVLYYSQTGTTKAVAEEIRAQTGADICAFDVDLPYTGNFDQTIQRCLGEREQGVTPNLAALDCDLSKYDVVFLGYPVWFGTYAPPVKALLEKADLAGKTVVPFCTFGSGGLQSSCADLAAALPNSEIKPGYGVRAARVYAIKDELNRFLIENGWKEGTVEPLPEYSAPEQVTAGQAAIFDAACSGYQFPLGTPVSCGSRKVPGGTDYVFIAESGSPDGTSSQSKIYVIVRDGQNPEFTSVVRND